MNKQNQREQQLERHYSTLDALGKICGSKLSGKRLSTRLYKLEQQATRITTDYCNGVIDNPEKLLQPIEKQIADLFNGKLNGFFINRDPRGYALKIDTEETQQYIDQGVDLHRDWGGYGILSPEIQ